MGGYGPGYGYKGLWKEGTRLLGKGQGIWGGMISAIVLESIRVVIVHAD